MKLLSRQLRAVRARQRKDSARAAPASFCPGRAPSRPQGASEQRPAPQAISRTAGTSPAHRPPASPPPRCAPGPVSRRAPSEGPPPVAGSVGFLDVSPVVPQARCFGACFSGAVITVGVPDVGFALSPLRAVHPADGSVSQPLLPASLREASPPPSQRRRRWPVCGFLSEEVFHT